MTMATISNDNNHNLPNVCVERRSSPRPPSPRSPVMVHTSPTLRMLKAIGSVPWVEYCEATDINFLADMFTKAGQYGDRLVVSMRQLLRLRAIVGGLCEAGRLDRKLLVQELEDGERR